MTQEEHIRIEKKLNLIDSKVNSVDSRLGMVEATMVTRDEFHTTMDEVLTIVRRLDEERVFTLEWVRRIESDLERVKQHLHLI